MVPQREWRNAAVAKGSPWMNKLLLAGLAITIGACDRAEVDEKNASAAGVAEAISRAGEAVKFSPGRWESNVTIVSMDGPGVPAEARRTMQGAFGKAQFFATCLTKEQAEKPAAEFFSRDAKACTYDHFTMDKGKVDAKMQCGKDGRAVVATMNGNYGTSNYDMTMETKVDGGNAGPMSMKMKVESRRVGQCRGNEGKLS